MSKYDIEYRKLTLQLLPMSLRRVKIAALIYRLIVPCVDIYTRFLDFKAAKTYRLSNNAQVYSLEKVICDYCHSSGCYITDGEYITELLVPHDGNGDLMNYQVKLASDENIEPQLMIPYVGFGHADTVDFIVHLPAVLLGNVDEAALSSLINEYKLAGKSYRIIYDGVTVAKYSYVWSDDICEMSFTPEYVYNFVWSEDICVRQSVEQYTYAWGIEVCAQVDEYVPHVFIWTDDICIQEDPSLIK